METVGDFILFRNEDEFNKHTSRIWGRHECIDMKPTQYPCYIIFSQYNDQSVRIDSISIEMAVRMVRKLKQDI